MRTLINDLLTYSRVTTKAQPFAECDLNRVINEVVADLQLQIDEAGAQIRVDSVPTIEADGLQMRQLVQNLLSNSLKYRRTDVPLVVQFSSAVDDGSPNPNCEIRISDNGIGFEMTYAERIFAIFQRLHGHQDVPGTGIGLATCRKIVERHGGSIRAESAPGEGSVFIVTLPTRHNTKGKKLDHADG